MDQLRTADRNRFINTILLSAAIILLATSIYSVYHSWRMGLAQSRVETASQLMAIQTSPRSTETPGINAWVAWSLLNDHLSGNGQDLKWLRKLVYPQSSTELPTEFHELLNTLRIPCPKTGNEIEYKTDLEISGQSPPDDLEFREVKYVQNQEQLFVVTARNNEDVQDGLEVFCKLASTHLSLIKTRWQEKAKVILQPDTPIGSARVSRFYVLNEDESLLSLPLGNQDGDNFRLYLSEGEEFRKNPLSPSFVTNNFFFNFQFGKPLNEQASYSGLYLDLGGVGMVASVTIPVIYEGKRSVLGADVAFDIDWSSFANELSPNLISHVAQIDNSGSRNWSPWNEFANATPDSKPTLQREIRYLADIESRSSETSIRKTVYLANDREGGNIMAIQVNRSTWLLLQSTARAVRLPWAMMLLTGLVFFALVFRIEQSRKHAVTAQKNARGEMLEKQNLLDTMKVPLMVVDPNTDELVYCNRAANSIGMSKGCYFGRDVVKQDKDAQEHYLRTQSLSEEMRRAYGVPIHTTQLTDADNRKEHFAIVRSVAVTAPIETLNADERHRLGILFLIDEQKDLDLLLRKRVEETRNDEKRRLANLLNHGIDSLARILRSELKNRNTENQEFVGWLGMYLSERIQLLAWTLENWGSQQPVSEPRIITCDTIEATIGKYEHAFRLTASDRKLREKLHWNNGIVSDFDTTNSTNIIVVNTDWSKENGFTVPQNGVFGFFIGEVLVNAIRHGSPGSKIEFHVTENRIRNVLEFEVSNQFKSKDSSLDVSRHTFGGIAILNELSRLCRWTGPEIEYDSDNFRFRWSIPIIKQKQFGQTD